MRTYGDTSIKFKLRLIIMATSILALVLVSAAIMLYEYIQYKDNLTGELLVLSEMIGDQVTAALDFDDPQSANETLAALEAKKSVEEAVIYTQSGEVFAKYRRSDLDMSFLPSLPPEETYYFKNNRLNLFHDIVINNNKKGTLYLRSDQHEIYTRIKRDIFIVAVFVIVSLFAAYLLSIRLQQTITEPIAHLVETSNTVAEYRDYSIRAEKKTSDEVGVLIDSFNEMLSQIQNRDLDIRESEQKYKTLVENIPQKIFYKDINSVYVACNDNYAEDLNISPDQIVGKTDYDFYPKELAEKYRSDDKRIIKSGRVETIEEDYVLQDGQKFIIQTVKTPIWNEKGNVIGLLGIFMDITERKQAEHELVRLSTAIEQSKETIMIMGTDGIVQYVNPALEQSLQYSRDELIGKNSVDFEKDPSQKELYQEVWKIINQGTVWSGNIISTRKDGTQFTADVNISPVHDSAGKIICFASIGRDITKELMLEQQLQQAQKMESIGTMAGGIAHDFNNILAIILGNTELAMDELESDNPAYMNLEQISSASLKAKGIVQQILAFSRKAKYDKKPLRFTPLVKETLGMLRSTIPTTIEIKEEIACKSDTIIADYTQINQVLINLCTNAEQEMHETGGILTVSLNNIELRAENIVQYQDIKPGRYVRLTVSDTGRGIAPENINRIFDPFFTTKGREKGTGLGLSVIHGIVKQHGGEIKVESEQGKGSKFHIYLPVSYKEAAAEKKVSESLPTGKEKLLIVDDETALANMLGQMLERLGYRVTMKSNGIEALETFRSQPDEFDLVITDQTMPHMTGEMLTKELLNIRGDIPVILSTGYSDLITDEKIRELGIKGFLMKPYERKSIAKAIREVLDKKV